MSHSTYQCYKYRLYGLSVINYLPQFLTLSMNVINYSDNECQPIQCHTQCLLSMPIKSDQNSSHEYSCFPGATIAITKERYSSIPKGIYEMATFLSNQFLS